jgi:aconitate hydratase
VTATDLVLTVTEMLRKEKVVGKFVEFFGEGAATLPLPDRATIANMAPEYGATMGFFPVDDKTIEYFEPPAAPRAEIDAFEAYFKAQGLFGMPKAGEIDYSQTVELDLSTVAPVPRRPEAPAGPHRDRQREGDLRRAVLQAHRRERLQEAGGRPRRASRPRAASRSQRRRPDRRDHLVHQHLEPRRAARRRPARQEGGREGPEGRPHIKTSLAPGSRS